MKEEIIAACCLLIVCAGLLWFGVKDLVLDFWDRWKQAWEDEEDGPPGIV